MKLKKLKGFAIGEDNNSFMRLTIGFNSNTKNELIADRIIVS